MQMQEVAFSIKHHWENEDRQRTVSISDFPEVVPSAMSKLSACVVPHVVQDVEAPRYSDSGLNSTTN